MTITEDRAAEYRDSDKYRYLAAELAKRPPLPTVEEVAGPVVRALQSLHDLGAYNLGDSEYHASAIEYGEFLDEADARIALVEGVANAIELAVGMFLVHDQKGMHAANARAMVLAIVNIDELRVERHRLTHERMAFADDEVTS